MTTYKCACQARAAAARARSRAAEDEQNEENENESYATHGARVSGPLGGRTGAAGCGHDHSRQGARVSAPEPSPAGASEQLRGGVLFGDQVTDAVDFLGPYGGLSPEQIKMIEYRRSIGCPCLGRCTCGRLRRVPAANAGNMSVLNNQKAVCSCRRRWWG